MRIGQSVPETWKGECLLCLLLSIPSSVCVLSLKLTRLQTPFTRASAANSIKSTLTPLTFLVKWSPFDISITYISYSALQSYTATCHSFFFLSICPYSSPLFFLSFFLFNPFTTFIPCLSYSHTHKLTSSHTLYSLALFFSSSRSLFTCPFEKRQFFILSHTLEL